MNVELREVIVENLHNVIEAFKKEDEVKLKDISDYTIDFTHITQDQYSSSFAIIVYALAKLVGKSSLRNSKSWKSFKKNVEKELLLALKQLKQNNVEKYHDHMKNILKRISLIDQKLNKYIIEVLRRSKIKKSSKLLERGLSIGKAADLMGVSSWELLDYVGSTKIFDTDVTITIPINERLDYLRNFANKKKNKMIFDTGTIISLSSSNMLWILEPLRRYLKSDFYIPFTVEKELIKDSLKSLKYRFESFQIAKMISDKVIKKSESKHLIEEIENLSNIINNIFSSNKRYINIAHFGELGVIVLAKELGSKLIVMDERTIRTLIEDPFKMRDFLEKKLHKRLKINKKNLELFQNYVSGMKVVRSIELAVIAYEIGLFDIYLQKDLTNILEIKKLRIELLKSILWALKLRGCTVSEAEINNILKIEGYTPL